MENPRRVFLHCLATSLSSLLYVPLCVLAPSLTFTIGVLLCLLYARKTVSAPSLTSAAQCKRPTPLLNTDSPKMENGDSAPFVSWLS